MTNINQTQVLDTPGLGKSRSLGERAELTNPALIAQARLTLIREALADDLDRLVMFGEVALIAIDSEDDAILIRMFDQATKVFLSAAGNVRELLAIRGSDP
jgi:hypothetical protein